MNRLLRITGWNHKGNHRTKYFRPVVKNLSYRDVETGRLWVLGNDRSLFRVHNGRFVTLLHNCRFR
jgi:hypothetical protein